MKKFIVTLIVFVLCFNFFVGCSTGNANNNVDVSDSSAEPKMFEQTDIVLVSNKSTDYQIVIPNESTATSIFKCPLSLTFPAQAVKKSKDVTTLSEQQ